MTIKGITSDTIAAEEQLELGQKKHLEMGEKSNPFFLM